MWNAAQPGPLNLWSQHEHKDKRSCGKGSTVLSLLVQMGVISMTPSQARRLAVQAKGAFGMGDANRVLS